MPTTPTPLGSSHGITLSFNGTTGLIRRVNDIEISFSDAFEDTSDLTLEEGATRTAEPKPMLGTEEVKIEATYPSGATLPKINDEGDLSTSLGDISGYAVCTNATVVLQTGEYVTLSMSFRVGEADE